jgi:hypothetical protein
MAQSSKYLGKHGSNQKHNRVLAYRDEIAGLTQKNAILSEGLRQTEIEHDTLKTAINRLYVETPGLLKTIRHVKTKGGAQQHKDYLRGDMMWRLSSQVLVDFLRRETTLVDGGTCVCIPRVNYRPAESYYRVDTGSEGGASSVTILLPESVVSGKSAFSLSRTIEHVIDRGRQYSGVSRGASRSSRKKGSQPKNLEVCIKNLEVCVSKKKSSKTMDSLMVFGVSRKKTGGGHINLLYFDASAETIFLVEPNGYKVACRYDGESQLDQAMGELPAKFKNWKYELLQIGNVHTRFLSPDSGGVCMLVCMWIIIEYCRSRTTTKTGKTLQVFTEELMGFLEDLQPTHSECPPPTEKDVALSMQEFQSNGLKQQSEHQSNLLEKKKTTQKYLQAMKKTAEDFKQYHARYSVRYMVERSVGALNRHFGYEESNMFVLLSGTGGAGYESGGESVLLTVNPDKENEAKFVVARQKLGGGRQGP